MNTKVPDFDRDLTGVLVHACCAPCACVLPRSTKFFFNGDNFDTRDEYLRRRAAMEVFAPDAVIDEYDPKVFPGCAECIRYRLVRCAEVAKENGFMAFTTTLTVSPHKNTGEINAIGREVGESVGISFIELDLKKHGGFLKSVRVAKELGLYRQNYCGCNLSARKLR